MNPMALAFVTSPPFLATYSTRSKLGFTWILLMKLVNLLYGIG